VATPSRLDPVINLAKRRGFVFQAGEIYGGSRSAWDYGPLGVALKENIKRQWWQTMVNGRDDVVGLDSSVILPRRVWEASGHVEVFSDPLVESLHTHKRYRADHLLEAYEAKHGHPPVNGLADIKDPDTGQPGSWTEPQNFSGLLKTFLGPVDNQEGMHYLRPETAQGIFVNFANVLSAARQKPPFGIGQIGKSFRNEITPQNWIFRTREFEQMEMEFFVEPGTDAENRTDYDLRTHSEASGQDLSYFDQTKNERWIPYVIEPAAGLTRSMMAFLVDAYHEDEAPNAKGGVDKRTVLRLDRRLAPVKVAVLPLSRNEKLSPVARELAAELRKVWNIEFDDAGAIGRRYRRQDEIGTPFCVTIDFDTLDDRAVTVRERDTMGQERIPLDDLMGYLAGQLIGA